MQIQILTVDKVSATTAKGDSYIKLEVNYKDLDNGGKVAKKLVMPFGTTKNAHQRLAEAKTNEVFEITQVKNDKGYWDWTGAKQAAPGSAAPAAQATPASAPAARSGGSWETPEERAAKQVLIVKQSSLSAAVAMLTTGAKSPPDVAKVKELAQELTDFVFGKEEKKNLFDMPSDNIDDDIPM